MNALVGIIRQLASLSSHAETLFADLFNEVRSEEIELFYNLVVCMWILVGEGMRYYARNCIVAAVG